MLEFEPVFELIELLELDPPIDELDVEAPLLLIDRLDVVAAMGAETLLVCGGRGSATVTD